MKKFIEWKMCCCFGVPGHWIYINVSSFTIGKRHCSANNNEPGHVKDI